MILTSNLPSVTAAVIKAREGCDRVRWGAPGDGGRKPRLDASQAGTFAVGTTSCRQIDVNVGAKSLSMVLSGAMCTLYSFRYF